jgi:hypothetical protein
VGAARGAHRQAFALSLLDPGGTLRARADRAGRRDLAHHRRAHERALARLPQEALDSALALARDVLANRDIDKSEIGRRNFEGDLEWSAAEKNPQSMLQHLGAAAAVRGEGSAPRAVREAGTCFE